MASSGVAHSGGYSVVGTNRTFAYQGPAYDAADRTGKIHHQRLGRCSETWPAMLGALQVRLDLPDEHEPGLLRRRAEYRQRDAPEHLDVVQRHHRHHDELGVDCLPTGATPGVVRLASALPQSPGHRPDPYPNLYLDDLVVQVTDGHNLVGNPNFEAGVADGWSLSAGSSTRGDRQHRRPRRHEEHAPDRAIDPGRRTELVAADRRGPLRNFVLGAARACLSGDAEATYDLMLQPTYNCITPSGQMTPPPIATVTAVPKNTWVELKGTATFPPADAPAGCKLSLAAVYVRHDGHRLQPAPCPELFVDDVSVTLAP